MATASTSKLIAIQQAFLGLGLTANEIQLIRDVILYGYWGDTSVAISKTEWCMANGYIINDADQAGHFAGKRISGLTSGIAKALNSHKCPFMQHCPDYWEDGSGDIFLFLENFASSDELEAWARTTPEEIRAAMATVESEACKADRKALEAFKARESQREHDERIKAVEDRRNNYVAKLKDCQDRKRTASLKRKIARAEARLEVLRSIDGLFKKSEEK